MRGGALPVALLCAAVGFALAFAPRRAIAPSLLALVGGAAVMSFAPLTLETRETVFIACWAILILTAASVHLPGGIGRWLALVLAAAAGAAAGSLVAVAGAPTDLLKALPWALICFPGGWLVTKGRGIAIKVAASWLIAVALLAAALPVTPTPGYEPDHME